MVFGRKLALLAPLLVVVFMAAVFSRHCAFASTASRGGTAGFTGDSEPVHTSEPDTTDRSACGRGPQETADRFEPGSPGQGVGLEVQRDLAVGEKKAEGSMGSFLELARARFVERVGRPATKADENWSFDHIQVSLMMRDWGIRVVCMRMKLMMRDLAGGFGVYVVRGRASVEALHHPVAHEC